jgi:hypothetical protein
VAVGRLRLRLRQLLRHHKISLQRTRTWKESTDPEREAKLDRIEQVTTQHPDRCFTFDQFGPPSIRPATAAREPPPKHPGRLPATHRDTHGIRCFHGCYSLDDDRLWGEPTPQGRRSHPGGAQVDPCRLARLGDSNHPNHTVPARRLQGDLRWRNADARHPDGWPPNAANVPASAAYISAAGAVPTHRRHDQTRSLSVSAHQR